MIYSAASAFVPRAPRMVGGGYVAFINLPSATRVDGEIKNISKTGLLSEFEQDVLDVDDVVIATVNLVDTWVAFCVKVRIARKVQTKNGVEYGLEFLNLNEFSTKRLDSVCRGGNSSS